MKIREFLEHELEEYWENRLVERLGLTSETRQAMDIIASAFRPQWQPIETAPKDASVLVTFTRGDIPEGQKSMPGVMVAYWDAYYAEGGNGHDGVGNGWTDAHSGEQCHLHYGHPTHWQPLPVPPEDKP